jgi:hypothetical protein
MQRYLRTPLIVVFVLSFLPAAFAQKNEGLGVVAPQKPQLDKAMPPPIASPAPSQTLGSAPPPTSTPKATKKRTKPPASK